MIPGSQMKFSGVDLPGSFGWVGGLPKLSSEASANSIIKLKC